MADGIFNSAIFNDGVFNSHGAGVGNFTLSGTHATQAFFTARPEQLIPIEFTFIIRAGIIAKFKETFTVQSTLLEKSQLKIELKLPILVKTRTNYEVYGYIIEKVRSEKSYLKAFYIPALYTKNERVKKLLLEKLTEGIDDG